MAFRQGLHRLGWRFTGYCDLHVLNDEKISNGICWRKCFYDISDVNLVSLLIYTGLEYFQATHLLTHKLRKLKMDIL